MISQWRSRPHDARHRLHRRTPWLFFHRDHPLSHERWKKLKKPKRKYEESVEDQMERLGWILALPDDDDEPR